MKSHGSIDNSEYIYISQKKNGSLIQPYTPSLKLYESYGYGTIIAALVGRQILMAVKIDLYTN